METQHSSAAQQALVHDLATLGSLYAEKAQTLLNIAAHMETFDAPPQDGTHITPEQARDRASYAVLCANFMAVVVRRINAGDCDPELLELAKNFTTDAAAVGDLVRPAGS